MPSSLLMRQKSSSHKGFVNTSANWSFVSTYIKETFFRSTWSFKKWCRTLICLVHEWSTEFFDKFIVLVLSQNILVSQKCKPKSMRFCFIQSIWAQHKPAAMYSASVVDNATQFCFLEAQETNEFPRKWHVPLVLLRSTRFPAKSASQ